LVVCGGARPVIRRRYWHCENLDQHLNMQAVERAASACCEAASQRGRIRSAVQHLLDTPSFTERAARMSDAFRRYDAPSAFAAATARILGREGRE
jgi:UDP:flavonoid glycosyltransferase YjiC (YdhE family)